MVTAHVQVVVSADVTQDFLVPVVANLAAR